VSAAIESRNAAASLQTAAGPVDSVGAAEGEAVGLTVNRDQMVREMTDFARECDQPRRGAPVRRDAYER